MSSPIDFSVASFSNFFSASYSLFPCDRLVLGNVNYCVGTLTERSDNRIEYFSTAELPAIPNDEWDRFLKASVLASCSYEYNRIWDKPQNNEPQSVTEIHPVAFSPQIPLHPFSPVLYSPWFARAICKSCKRIVDDKPFLG